MARPTTTTKTAVSLPVALYEQLEAVRAERGLTRSGAVAEAIAEYVSKKNQASLTARIDAALSALESSSHDDDDALVAFELTAAQRTFARLDAEDGPYPPPRAARGSAPKKSAARGATATLPARRAPRATR